jgi:hypothetical protein
MDVNRRIPFNLVIITIAVNVSHAMGLAAKNLWGIAL